MPLLNLERLRPFKTRFVFGGASAIITIMGLIVGLSYGPNAKTNIIASVLVMGVADNISDSLGIHIFQEAEGRPVREVWISSLTNFTTRFGVSLLFVAIILLFPLKSAVIYSVVLGFLLLSFISYAIAVYNKTNPSKAVLEHIAIAAIVILASDFFGDWLGKMRLK